MELAKKNDWEKSKQNLRGIKQMQHKVEKYVLFWIISIVPDSLLMLYVRT